MWAAETLTAPAAPTVAVYGRVVVVAAAAAAASARAAAALPSSARTIGVASSGIHDVRSRHALPPSP